MIADLRPYGDYKESGLSWLGQVPGDWQLRRLKSAVANEIEQTDEMLRGEIYVALEHVESWTGRVRPQGSALFAGQVKRFRANDVLFAKLRPYLAKVTQLDLNGVCAGEFFVLRPMEQTLAASYLEHQLRAKPTIDVINGSTFGAKMPRANWQFVGNLTIALPSPGEQAAIVRFLEWSTRRLERAIRAKQQVIALLNEQKQAIIHRAVTRGLDPAAPLRPSGIPWLGDIPTHWEVGPSRRLFSRRTELARFDDVQLSATQAFGVIPQAEYEKRVGRRVVKISMHLDKRRHVERDDFVISMRSFQGGLERSWASGAIRSSYVVLKPSQEVDLDFFSYLLKSPSYIGALQATADFIRDGQDLTYGNFRQVPLPIVPLSEQRAISRVLVNATRRIEGTMKRLEQEVALFREYRTRLIADVVTGKLDVREAASRLPEADDAPADDVDPTDDEILDEESAE